MRKGFMWSILAAASAISFLTAPTAQALSCGVSSCDVSDNEWCATFTNDSAAAACFIFEADNDTDSCHVNAGSCGGGCFFSCAANTQCHYCDNWVTATCPPSVGDAIHVHIVQCGGGSNCDTSGSNCQP